MKNFKIKPSPGPADRPSLDKEGRKNFLKKVENFVCGNCGFEVIGDGYTDHCPKCLWGKHVDEEIPGDRAAECKGLMEPIEVQYLSGKYKILFKCTKCSHRFWVRSDNNDDVDKLIELTVR